MKQVLTAFALTLLLAPAWTALPWVPPLPDARGYAPLIREVIARRSIDDWGWALTQISLCAQGGQPPAEDLLMRAKEWRAWDGRDRVLEASRHCAGVWPAMKPLQLSLARHLAQWAPGRYGAALVLAQTPSISVAERRRVLERAAEVGDRQALQALAQAEYGLPAPQREALRAAASRLQFRERMAWRELESAVPPPLTPAQLAALPTGLRVRWPLLSAPPVDALPSWPQAQVRADWRPPNIGAEGYGPVVVRIVREGGPQDALWAAQQLGSCRMPALAVAVAQYHFPMEERGIGPFAPERVRADCASLSTAQFALQSALAKRAAQAGLPGAAVAWEIAEPPVKGELQLTQRQLLLRAALRGDLDALYWLAAAGDGLGLDRVERMAFAHAHEVVHARELPGERSMLFHTETTIPPTLTPQEQIRARAMGDRILAGLRPH